jgi:raffinose/stachyose/melibiose transport system substrate-binding protein
MLLILSLFSFSAFADVHITLLNTKAEIQAQLEDVAKVFSAENSGITLEIQPVQASTSPFQALSTLYASGNAPSLAMMDPADIPLFAEKFLDLKNEKWVKDSTDNFEAVKTKSGAIMAFPLTVEGYGLIYNKAVLAKAGVDPTTIHTTAALERAFQKVQASGTDALIIAPMDWSLAAHFLGIAYSVTAKNQSGLDTFIANLKAGKADVSKNKAFVGLLDTFDVMKKYNAGKADPLAITLDECPALLGRGKVGFYFMGDWAWPSLSSFAADQNGFSFIPVPLSNNTSDLGNSEIPVGVTKYIGIDKMQNSPEQQAAARKFLDWLVYSKSGQDAMVNTCSIIPAFKNITLSPTDPHPLSESIRAYVAKEQTLFWVSIPAPDHWSKVGASMQKYLADKIDRHELYAEINDFWKTTK